MLGCRMARLEPRWQRKKLVGKRKPADPIKQRAETRVFPLRSALEASFLRPLFSPCLSRGRVIRMKRRSTYDDEERRDGKSLLKMFLYEDDDGGSTEVSLVMATMLCSSSSSLSSVLV